MALPSQFAYGRISLSLGIIFCFVYYNTGVIILFDTRGILLLIIN